MTRLLTLASVVAVLAASMGFSASPPYRVGFVERDSALFTSSSAGG